MYDLTGALFLKVSFLFVQSLILLSFSKQCTHHYSHTNMILALEFQSFYSFQQSIDCLINHLLHFLFKNFDTVESFDNLDIS